MKASRNKAFYWAAATGNRPKGKLRKATLQQYIQWTKNWDAYEKAPQCYRLSNDKRIIPYIDARAFRRNFWFVYHTFASPHDMLWPVDTLYYDHEKAQT